MSAMTLKIFVPAGLGRDYSSVRPVEHTCKIQLTWLSCIFYKCDHALLA